MTKVLYAIYDPADDKFFRINFKNSEKGFLTSMNCVHQWDRKFHFAYMHPNKCTVFEMDDKNTLTKYIYDFCRTHIVQAVRMDLVKIIDRSPDFSQTIPLKEYVMENNYFE